jgi:hypothetical protein
MTKHRRITGFIAVALLAVAAATMRSPSTDRPGASAAVVTELSAAAK